MFFLEDKVSANISFWYDVILHNKHLWSDWVDCEAILCQTVWSWVMRLFLHENHNDDMTVSNTFCIHTKKTLDLIDFSTFFAFQYIGNIWNEAAQLFFLPLNTEVTGLRALCVCVCLLSKIWNFKWYLATLISKM